MTDAVPRRWTVEEFFAWQQGQAERYELADGFSRTHDGRSTERSRRHRRQRAYRTAQPGLPAMHRRRQHRDEARANPPPGHRRRLWTPRSQCDQSGLAARGRRGGERSMRLWDLGRAARLLLCFRKRAVGTFAVPGGAPLPVPRDSHKTYYGMFFMFPIGSRGRQPVVPSNSTRRPSYAGTMFGGSMARSFS